VTDTEWTSNTKGTGQYAAVNGLNLYSEIHGAGRPLILLHGGLGSGEMFGPVLPALAERHQVIAVDLQGHGRTADIDRPLDVRGHATRAAGERRVGAPCVSGSSFWPCPADREPRRSVRGRGESPASIAFRISRSSPSGSGLSCRLGWVLGAESWLPVEGVPVRTSG
jgi:hypothetical protein